MSHRGECKTVHTSSHQVWNLAFRYIPVYTGIYQYIPVYTKTTIFIEVVRIPDESGRSGYPARRWPRPGATETCSGWPGAGPGLPAVHTPHVLPTTSGIESCNRHIHKSHRRLSPGLRPIRTWRPGHWHQKTGNYLALLRMQRFS